MHTCLEDLFHLGLGWGLRSGHPAPRRSRPHGDLPPRKMIPASLLHIAGGYIQYFWLLSVRVAPRARRQLDPHEHFDSMVVRFTLDAKACDFRYGHPSSRRPYAQVSHVNRRQPGCDKRASVRRSLQEMQRGGCSKDPSPPRLDCHRMIMTASVRGRTA